MEAPRHDEYLPGHTSERACLQAMAGAWWATYVLTGAKPPQTVNCSWAVALALGGFRLPLRNTDDPESLYRPAIFLHDIEQPFSPVEEVIRKGLGEPATTPGPWTLCQGWTGSAPGKGSGHAFLIWDYHPGTGRVLSLEAHERYGLNGIGCRGLGNLRTTGNPGPEWFRDPRLPTFDALPWPHLRMARLNVHQADHIAQDRPIPGLPSPGGKELLT